MHTRAAGWVALGLIAYCFGGRLLAAESTQASLRSKLQPPAGRTLLIIGQDLESIQAYEKATGHTPAGLMSYTSIQGLEGIDSPHDNGAGIQHAAALHGRYPHSALQIGLYLVGALPAVLEGQYDAHIEKLARWMGYLKCPIYLRIGYEFEADHNHYDPAMYKQAFRYIVQQLNQHNVYHAAYVWHAQAAHKSHLIEQWYPGDDVVDWIGLSYFDQPEDQMDPVIAFAHAHNKPVMIAEATPKGIGVGMHELSWEAWFALLFDFVKRHDVQALSYINADWEAQPMWQAQAWEDARVQASDEVFQSWIQELKNPRYLYGSEHLFQLLVD